MKLVEQTHKKAEETLEFKKNKPIEKFRFTPPISIEGSWMIGLTDLEVYNSIINITEQNNICEPYMFHDEKCGCISNEKIRDEIEKDFGISDFTAAGLQDEIIAPIITKEYREQVTKRMKDGKYMPILAMYIDSVFQHFESFLRTRVDFVEDDIVWFQMNINPVLLLMN